MIFYTSLNRVGPIERGIMKRLMYTGTLVDGRTGKILDAETMDLLKSMDLWQRIGLRLFIKFDFEEWFNTALEQAKLDFKDGTMELLWTKFYSNNGKHIGLASLKVREFDRPLAWAFLNIRIEQK